MAKKTVYGVVPSLPLAQNLIAWSFRYLGHDYQRVIGAYTDYFINADKEKIDDALSTAVMCAMEGQYQRGVLEGLLARFHRELKLPVNLRRYAMDIMKTVELYGEPQKTIEQFPDLYEKTALPILKERLAAFGVSAQDIQQTLRKKPGIDPLYVVWLLGCVVPPIVCTDDFKHLDPKAIAFAYEILGQHPRVLDYDREPGDADNRALRALFDIDGLPDREFLLDNSPEKNQQYRYDNYLMHTSGLPSGLNRKFDWDRLAATAEHYASEDKRKGRHSVYKVTSHANAPALARLKTAGYETVVNPYQPARSGFFHYADERIKRDAILANLSWQDVPVWLRQKFEAAGYDSAEKIAAAINARPEQQKIIEHEVITLRHAHGFPGHVLDAGDVLLALTQPGKLRYAHGMAVNRAYETFRDLVDPTADIDAFYRQEKPTAETLEQLFIKDFSDKINDALSKDAVFRHIVSEEQKAIFLGIWVDQIEQILINLDELYGKDANKRAAILESFQEKFGISFDFQDCLTIREEREQTRLQKLAAARQERAATEALQAEKRSRKAAERKAREQAAEDAVKWRPAPPPNPWPDIPDSAVELCRRKGFDSFDSVVAAVQNDFEHDLAILKIQGQPRHVSREVKRALQNLAGGFLNLPHDRRSVTVAHDHLGRALAISLGDLAHVPKIRMNGGSNGYEQKSLIQADITGFMTSSRHLVHVSGWPQFAEEFKGADVVAILNNVAGAYQILKNTRDDLVITPNDYLLATVEAINSGKISRPVRPEGIVAVRTWLDAYLTKADKRSILPANITAEQFKIA